MSEQPSLEYLLHLLLHGDLNAEERRKIKEEMKKTPEFTKAKTINLAIKKSVQQTPGEDS